MLLRLLPIVIVGLVLSANVYWQVTPNAYLASLFGIIVAVAVMAFIVALARVSGRRDAKRRRSNIAR